MKNSIEIKQDIDHIGLYNLKVSNFLLDNPITPIQKEAIKHFKNNAKKDNLSHIEYNSAVEKFNGSSYLLKKKIINLDSPDIDYGYNYINYPYIDTEAFKETMRKYRLFVDEYNKQALEYNKQVRFYNSNFENSREAKTNSQINCFLEKNSSFFTKKFNQKTEVENEKFGKILIKKRNLQTIKYGSELIFQVVLGFYTKQLRQFTNKQIEGGISTRISKSGLKQVKIDQRKLATHKIDGIPRLGICKKTAQNHIKRLREAGLFTHYVYSNQFNAIKLSINNKVLVIFDGNLPKHQESENQKVTSQKDNVLPDNSDTTLKLLKEKEKKGDVLDIGSIITGSNPQSLKIGPAVSYKNTRRKQPKKNEEAAAQKSNSSNRISENLRKLAILDNQKFAKDLTNKVYDDYTVLRYDRLLKAIQYSNLTSSEFKKILIQDFIKQSAKIWKNHGVYEGNWKKTINFLEDNLFKNIVHKETMVQKLREYRWKINFARNWFIKNPQINALFPYQYFDVNRKTTSEIGFRGLHYAYLTHLKYNEKKRSEVEQLKVSANRRKSVRSDDKKRDNIMLKYFRNKVTFEKMYDYVENNLPEIYLTNLVKNLKNFNQII